MAGDPPDRITVSFPPGAEIDAAEIDRLVEESDCESRSEWIRRVIADASDVEDTS